MDLKTEPHIIIITTTTTIIIIKPLKLQNMNGLLRLHNSNNMSCIYAINH